MGGQNVGSSRSVYVGTGEAVSLGLFPAGRRQVRDACVALPRLQADQWCTRWAWAGTWRGKTALGSMGVFASSASSPRRRCAVLGEEWVARINAKTQEEQTLVLSLCDSSWLQFVSVLHRAGDSHTWALNRQTILLTDIPLQFPALRFFSGALQPAREAPVFSPEGAAFW